MTDTAQRTVILADGSFPSHPEPLRALRTAARIVCCDGAANKLLAAGLAPTVVVGDLDSLAPVLRTRHADRLVRDADQNTNDLAKAFELCCREGWTDPVILGATGLREDHTLGNISLLADFARRAATA